MNWIYGGDTENKFSLIDIRVRTGRKRGRFAVSVVLLSWNAHVCQGQVSGIWDCVKVSDGEGVWFFQRGWWCWKDDWILLTKKGQKPVQCMLALSELMLLAVTISRLQKRWVKVKSFFKTFATVLLQSKDGNSYWTISKLLNVPVRLLGHNSEGKRIYFHHKPTTTRCSSQDVWQRSVKNYQKCCPRAKYNLWRA